MTIAEAVPVKHIKLRDERTQLGLTQDELAGLAGISRRPIVRAESDRPIYRLTAWAILHKINEARVKRDMKPLAFDDMDWKIRGED